MIYCTQMPQSGRSNQQKRATAAIRPDTAPSDLGGWKNLGSVVVTFGLAAAVTGGFGVAGIFVTGRQRAQEQRCSIAGQIVLDESSNAALSGEQRSRLNALAMRWIEQCIGATE
jgi:hypothetical protein